MKKLGFVLTVMLVILLAFTAVALDEPGEDFAEIDTYLRANGFESAGSNVSVDEVLKIESLEEAQAVVNRLALASTAAVSMSRRNSDYGWLTRGSTVLTTYECQKNGALTTVTSKARVEIKVSGGAFTFDRFIAQWYELIGAPYGHDVRDIQTNNVFQIRVRRCGCS